VATESVASVPSSGQYAPVGVQMRNGLGIAALCCGLVGILVGLIPIMFLLSGALGILAIVFGAVGIRRVRRREASNRGMAITGLVSGIAAFALAIWGISIVFSAANSLNEELSRIHSDVSNVPTQTQASIDHQEHEFVHQGAWVWNSG
jgi:Domain of unknown function (DUF4190)